MNGSEGSKQRDPPPQRGEFGGKHREEATVAGNPNPPAAGRSGPLEQRWSHDERAVEPSPRSDPVARWRLGHEPGDDGLDGRRVEHRTAPGEGDDGCESTG
jgi:hypothetical protein